MLNRFSSLAVCLSFAASMAAFAQTQGTEYLFQEIPGQLTIPGQLAAYPGSGNAFNTIANISAPDGFSSIIVKPDGSGFYLIGTSGIEAVNSNFQSPVSVSLSASGLDPQGLAPFIASATLVPNGQYLLVGTSDGNNDFYLYVISTSTNQAITSNGLPLQLAGVPGYAQPAQNPACAGCFIAVSRDSSTAYVLENSINGGNTTIGQISLVSYQKTASLSIGGAGNALTLSPGGLLYFVGGNQITVIDPVAFAVTATVQLSGFNPGPLMFTPDGSAAYAIHQYPRLGGTASLLSFNPSNNTVNWYSPSVSQQSAGPQLSGVYVASDSQIFALATSPSTSTSLNTLYDVSPSAGINLTNPSPTITAAISSVAAVNVEAAAISNELPTAGSLFVLIANGNEPYIDRINLAVDQVAVSDLAPAENVGSTMQTGDVPAQGTASTFLTFNANQSVNNGNTSLPLIARAIASSGLPVFNTQGQFSVNSASGVVINTANVTSNADGYVQTTISIPTGGVTCPGNVCVITLNLGGASTTFNITVQGSTSGPSGPSGPSGTTSSQMTITGGDGQFVLSGNPAQEPLTVLVTDTNGNPVSGVGVTFTITGSGGIGSYGQCSSGTTCISTTDATGTATAYYEAGPVTSGGTQGDTILATATVGSNTFNVTFYETSYVVEQAKGPTIQLLSPVPGQYIQVSAGSPATDAIQALVLDVLSNPVQNVGVSIAQPDTFPPVASPAASCQGQPLSDQTGTVSCTVVTTCATQPGNYDVTIEIGGNFGYESVIQVLPAGNGATSVAATSGNNQSGNPGQKAALPLIATVTGFCGNIIQGAQVTWTVTAGSATLAQSSNTTNLLGQASDTVTFGSTAGTVTITATASTGGTATFTLTNNIVVSAITKVSGDGQTATTGQAFAQPLVVSVVDNNQKPIPNFQVSFTVTSGSATVNPGSATTGSNGQAQTTVTAGPNAGNVVVTASAGGLSQTFNLTVTPPGPNITATSFVNAASNAPGLVACGLGVVTGNGLASSVQGVVSGSNGFGPLPYTLSGVSMTMNGVNVPIQAVSNQNGVQQVNFQTPCELAGSSTATVVITVNNVATTITGVQVLLAQPGIFTYAGPNSTPYAVVISAQNGEYVTPSNPAVRGGMYYVVVTGLGQTSPAMITNNVSVAGQTVVPTMVVGVGNSGVPVISATAYPDTFGAYLVEFQIPTTASPGTNVPFAVAADINSSLVFGNSTFIPAIQ